tara:strand:+ start:339 stop:755 length:417 start_codon:yes stop_codon:yes gene_type:complete
MARDFRKLDIYHISYAFVLDIYKVTTTFPDDEEKNIVSQIRRASVSIPLNIAEGSAKSSPKEFVYFLNVAYASGKEVQVLLDLSRDLGLLGDDGYTFLSGRVDEINAKLFLFLRNAEQRIPHKRHHFFKKFEDKKDNI